MDPVTIASIGLPIVSSFLGGLFTNNQEKRRQRQLKRQDEEFKAYKQQEINRKHLQHAIAVGNLAKNEKEYAEARKLALETLNAIPEKIRPYYAEMMGQGSEALKDLMSYNKQALSRSAEYIEDLIGRQSPTAPVSNYRKAVGSYKKPVIQPTPMSAAEKAYHALAVPANMAMGPIDSVAYFLGNMAGHPARFAEAPFDIGAGAYNLANRWASGRMGKWFPGMQWALEAPRDYFASKEAPEYESIPYNELSEQQLAELKKQAYPDLSQESPLNFYKKLNEYPESIRNEYPAYRDVQERRTAADDYLRTLSHLRDWDKDKGAYATKNANDIASAKKRIEEENKRIADLEEVFSRTKEIDLKGERGYHRRINYEERSRGQPETIFVLPKDMPGIRTKNANDIASAKKRIEEENKRIADLEEGRSQKFRKYILEDKLNALEKKYPHLKELATRPAYSFKDLTLSSRGVLSRSDVDEQSIQFVLDAFKPVLENEFALNPYLFHNSSATPESQILNEYFLPKRQTRSPVFDFSGAADVFEPYYESAVKHLEKLYNNPSAPSSSASNIAPQQTAVGTAQPKSENSAWYNFFFGNKNEPAKGDNGLGEVYSDFVNNPAGIIEGYKKQIKPSPTIAPLVGAGNKAIGLLLGDNNQKTGLLQGIKDPAAFLTQLEDKYETSPRYTRRQKELTDAIRAAAAAGGMAGSRAHQNIVARELAGLPDLEREHYINNAIHLYGTNLNSLQNIALSGAQLGETDALSTLANALQLLQTGAGTLNENEKTNALLELNDIFTKLGYARDLEKEGAQSTSHVADQGAQASHMMAENVGNVEANKVNFNLQEAVRRDKRINDLEAMINSLKENIGQMKSPQYNTYSQPSNPYSQPSDPYSQYQGYYNPYGMNFNAGGYPGLSTRPDAFWTSRALSAASGRDQYRWFG